MSKDSLYQGPIFVKKSPLHGYGVFAATDLAENELVEECHTIFTTMLDPAFNNYYFRRQKELALPLGYGCIYNHSDTPNLVCAYDLEGSIFYFNTLRPIQQGEELCVSYGESWFAQRQLKSKANPGWLQAVRLSKGLVLRAFFVYCGCLALIQGLKYLSS